MQDLDDALARARTSRCLQACSPEPHTRRSSDGCRALRPRVAAAVYRELACRHSCSRTFIWDRVCATTCSRSPSRCAACSRRSKGSSGLCSLGTSWSCSESGPTARWKSPSRSSGLSEGRSGPAGRWSSCPATTTAPWSRAGSDESAPVSLLTAAFHLPRRRSCPGSRHGRATTSFLWAVVILAVAESPGRSSEEGLSRVTTTLKSLASSVPVVLWLVETPVERRSA